MPIGVQGTRYKQVFLPYVYIHTSYGLEESTIRGDTLAVPMYTFIKLLMMFKIN